MKILVTAGNTRAMIDRVRCVTNVFSGRTGATIAEEAARRGHAVTLLTSRPETADGLGDVREYQTYEDLAGLMAFYLTDGGYNALIHSAAVSDYLCAEVRGPGGPLPAGGKVKSDHDELWLRLVRAPKLIDRVRSDWGFAGVVVKFKLEVGVDEDALLQTAEASRERSSADVMVANTLEAAADWAYIGTGEGDYRRVPRSALPGTLLDVVSARSK